MLRIAYMCLRISKLLRIIELKIWRTTKMKVTTGTIARTVVLAVSLLNVLLNAFGKNPLPFSDDEVYTAVSTVVAVVASWPPGGRTTALQKLP